MSVHKGRYLLCQVLQVSVTSLFTSDHRGTRETSKILMSTEVSVHKGRYLLCQVLQVSVTSLLTSDHRGTRETSKILMEYGSECP